MRTIRASELGAYRFCKRSWWYRKQGLEPSNTVDLDRGTEFHRQHGRAVVAARLYRLAGYALLLVALVAAVIAVTLALV
jgi:hypothetical protein